MIAQETSNLKRDQRDFALWKSQKTHEDAAWDSPWGAGRPGWHIECSAMAEKFLGHEFEIHGGGNDLRFPHHENELAQSSGLGHAFARIWMHNGMLELDAAKMSKSRRRDPEKRARRMGPRGAARVPPLGCVEQAGRLRRRGHAAGGGACRRFRDVFRNAHAARPKETGSASRTRWRTTSTHRRRSRSCTNGGITSCCDAPSRYSGSSPSQRLTSAAGHHGARWATTGRAGGARLRRGRSSSLGARDSGLGSAGRAGRLSARPTPVTRDLVYGRRPVRELLRGPRELNELWATERAAAQIPGSIRAHACR